MKSISKSLEETKKIAKEFVSFLSPFVDKACVVGLYGNLGAGKTSFTQGVAQALGINETVTSPTFVIEKIYELENQKFTRLIHIDAYRIEKSEEMLHLGFAEIIKDSNNLILIEWPENIQNIMPAHIQVRLEPLPLENSREIEVIKEGVV